MLQKELNDAQSELDYVQADKRKAEALVDSQKKELRALKIELNTLRAELDEGCSRDRDRDRDRDYRNNGEKGQERQDSVVLFSRKPILPKRDNQPSATVRQSRE